jgi:C4-dicarboxylate transporter DctM subunit
MIALVSFLVMIGLMLFNVPIALCTGFAAITGIVMSSNISYMTFVQRLYVGMDSFTLIAVPLFMLCGRFMALGGITKDLIGLANALVGRFKGGMLHVNVVASMFFAGITGSAAADTASIGGILIPATIEKGFDADVTVAVTATSSTIGVMIPPSIPMVVFGVTAGVSIGKLFLGGIVPGILVGLALIIVNIFYSRKRNYPAEKPYSGKETIHAVVRGLPALLTVVIILGGITSGLFTPTEAAGIACLYTFLLGRFMYRELFLKDIPNIMLEVAVTTGQVVLMIATASALGWVFAHESVPAIISSFVLGATKNKFLILLLINLLLLFVGTWMDLSPAVTVFCPILMPIILALGIDPVHFGIIMVINLAIGLFTPPVGVCLFLACGIGKISITQSIKAFIPYFVSMLLVLLLITYWPQLVMLLPNMMG